jgi:hypothetical protein
LSGALGRFTTEGHTGEGYEFIEFMQIEESTVCKSLMKIDGAGLGESEKELDATKRLLDCAGRPASGAHFRHRINAGIELGHPRIRGQNKSCSKSYAKLERSGNA